MSLLLAIESSCDEMAMAVLKDQREFLSSVVASQIDIMITINWGSPYCRAYLCK